MSRKRRSYESGHKPKYLVIIDESPECDRAVYYASRRASRTGAGMLMLLVIAIIVVALSARLGRQETSR